MEQQVNRGHVFLEKMFMCYVIVWQETKSEIFISYAFWFRVAGCLIQVNKK